MGGLLAVVVLLQAVGLLLPATSQGAGACGLSEVACENQLPGNPASEWDVAGVGDTTIAGFSTDISVNVGQTVHFKISSTTTNYTIDIYRMGYYQGNGARKVATITPTASALNQPPCITDSATNLVDCGNWRETASWAVPASAVSGVYFAKLTRSAPAGDNHIVFVVRKDAQNADVLYQTSDTTWQAYNAYGGSNFYGGTSGRATKLSYNRPFTTRSDVPDGRDWVFANEYPMIRWMERNGYDVSYQSGLDTERSPGLLLNHKAFLSVGHDEYWTRTQREHVEAARDAGVNLAFFSGNEMYWQGRWEPSIDGTSTANRTYVTYKETWDNAKTDPSPEWTGTFRDPRFSPPSNGGRPENNTTGTLYTVNCCALALQVPPADGKMRLWRNTAAANLAANAPPMTLAANTIGYEFDETPDNGFAPPGLVPLSTTTGAVSQLLTDYGNTVVAGNATHHLTLYRAASGALVFGGGTVQYSWGLDANHDGTGNPPENVTMQQATLNLLADMGVQPTTRQANLLAATKTTDTAAPTVVINTPTAGSTVAGGTNVTISGTATDAAGQVGAVEVSADNGTTWHPATGRGSWTYTWQANGSGTQTIKVRAADDSGNLSTPVTRTITTTCPCTVFGATAPFTPAMADSSAVTLGVKVRADANGWISGVRFYKGAGNTGTHVGSLWSTAGVRLATATFTGESASGWQQVTFGQAVQVTAGTTFIASYYAPVGHYAADQNFFNGKGADAPPLHALASGVDGPNGVFGVGNSFPNEAFGAPTNYGVDAIYTTVAPPDTSAPVATVGSPAAGAGSQPLTTAPTVQFNEPVQPATVTFTVKAGATNIAGTTAFDGVTNLMTFTPTAPLTAATTYTVAVSGAKDAVGNTQVGTLTWTFTTAAAPRQPGVCPCTIWQDTDAPAVIDSGDGSAVELGAKFRADQAGTVTGVRFYKGTANTGTHTGSLWSATGTRLALVTFTGETISGWQQASFSSPVAITAGTTYVISYLAPAGHYSVTSGFFNNGAVSSPPLTALSNVNTDAPDGLYRYGTGGGFPNSSYNGGNYWVEPVFVKAADVTAPTVVSTTPANGSASQLVTTTVKTVFSEDVQPTPVTYTLKAGTTTVPGAVAYTAATRTFTFTPSAALAPATTYTAAISGVKDAAGNTMAGTTTWTFRTSSGCPCSLFPTDATPGTPDSTDGGAVTLGMRFTPDANGTITAVRFYKSAANTGTHTAKLWSNTGAELATVTFTGETASGWQQATLSTPVAVTAGTTYVVGYLAPVGHYAVDLDWFATQAFDNSPLHGPVSTAAARNGLYSYGATIGFPVDSWRASNYWVDVVFAPS